MTVENLITGICETLSAEYDYPVYTERNEQDMETPCFFVRSYRNKNEQQNRYKFLHDIDVEILFFPTETKVGEERRAKAEINDVSDRLLYLLRTINVNGELVGTREREAVPQDDTMVMTFTVSIDEIEKREVDLMQTEHTEVTLDGQEGARETISKEQNP